VGVVDVTIAMQQMVLTETAEGLGTCWIGSFSEESVKALLKVPQQFKIVAMFALGFPKENLDVAAGSQRTWRRRPLEEIVSREEF